MIALPPLELLDYKETDMKNARLIKRKRANAQIPSAIAWFLREINSAMSDVREWRTNRRRALASASASSVIGSKSFEKEA